jgi:hypothetical protein
LTAPQVEWGCEQFRFAWLNISGVLVTNSIGALLTQANLAKLLHKGDFRDGL